MGSIKGSVSLLKNFVDSCPVYYSAIFDRAENLKNQATGYHNECEQKLSAIASQIARLHSLKSEISAKVLNYKNLMDEAKEEVSRCEAEIHYIKTHPMIITEFDADGNPYERRVIDQAALAAATHQKNEAMQVYRLYKAKFTEAKNIENNVSSAIENFTKTEMAMKLVTEQISKDIFEIEKDTKAISMESEHNIQSIVDVHDAMDKYVSSKQIAKTPALNFDNLVSGSYDYITKNTEARVGYVERPRVTTPYIDSKVSILSIVTKTLYKINQLADKNRFNKKKKMYQCKFDEIDKSENSKLKKFILKGKYKVSEKISEIIHGFAEEIMNKISKEVRNIQVNQRDLKSYISLRVLANVILSLPEKILEQFGYKKTKEFTLEQMLKNDDFDIKFYAYTALHYLKIAIPYKINKFKENRELKRKNKK